MQVKRVMTNDVRYIPSSTTLKQAAEIMRSMDCGFLPVGDSADGKLLGVITDRDIAMRGIAEGMDPIACTVKDVLTEKVLYCFQNDSLESAAKSMEAQQVYRLIVLNNKTDKRLCGIITLGDIVRHSQTDLVAKTVGNIAA